MKRYTGVFSFDWLPWKVAMDETPQTISSRCCIVGGESAATVLGFLLARAGVDTTVLEKHGDAGTPPCA